MLQSITGEPAKPSGTFTLYLQFLCLLSMNW